MITFHYFHTLVEPTHFIFALKVILAAFPTSLQDVEMFVNDSGDDGFIVFTLGSMVPSMPEDRAKEFFDAFRQIPQKVTMTDVGN